MYFFYAGGMPWCSATRAAKGAVEGMEVNVVVWVRGDVVKTDGSSRNGENCMVRHRRIQAVWFHLYEIQVQAGALYGNKNQQVDASEVVVVIID